MPIPDYADLLYYLRWLSVTGSLAMRRQPRCSIAAHSRKHTTRCRVIFLVSIVSRLARRNETRRNFNRNGYSILSVFHRNIDSLSDESAILNVRNIGEED